MPVSGLPTPGLLTSSEEAVAGSLQLIGSTSGSGPGFTWAENGTGDVTVTFTRAFSSAPVVVVCPGQGNSNRAAACGNVTTTSFRAWVYEASSGALVDETLNFIAYIPSTTKTRVPRDFGIVTALPTSPTPQTGDRCVYTDSLTAPTYRWQLVYNGSSSSSYKWEVVGGTPMAARDDDQRSSTSASYVDVPTDQISLTTPVAGDWDVTLEGVPQTTGVWTGYHSYAVGATAASDAWGIHAGTGGSSSDVSSSKRTRHTGLAASTVIKEQIRTSSAGSAAYTSHRRLWAMPVRVG